MRYSAVILTLICALSATARAGNKYMYSFGGAGDPPNEVNTFTSEFDLLAVTAKGYGWKNHILFNGQHPKDIEEVKSQAGDNVKKFSQQNFAQSLKQIQQDLTSGKIKAGDQIMIVIDTHGAPTSSGKSHLIACNDGLCDLKKLDQILRSLESKGVKTAVVDLSCYSGHSLNLASDKTCVISGSSTDDVAWNTFSVGFTSALQPGHSLEEAFLQTRGQVAKGLPQISSPAGVATSATMRALSKESILYLDVSDFLKKQSREQICTLNLSQLKKTMQQFGDLQGALTLSAYTQAVSNYQKLYQQANTLAQQINTTGGLQQVISWSEIYLV
jgi:hypothetical protein